MIGEREAIVRAFAAKIFYNYPTISSLITTLQETRSLRQICGFAKKSDIISEATFWTFCRSFQEFAVGWLGDLVDRLLMETNLYWELLRHFPGTSRPLKGEKRRGPRLKRESGSSQESSYGPGRNTRAKAVESLSPAEY